MTTNIATGGCQCGAVRFAATGLGRPSICHCRMCQKAFGSFFGPFVGAHELTWTRGSPKYFQSSNKATRGFCAECGTPLTYMAEGGHVELAIGAFDRPAEIVPKIQLSPETRMPWLDTLATLPTRSEEEEAKVADFYVNVISHQHPDHDTQSWTPGAQGREGR
jgi:hypothetical protein